MKKQLKYLYVYNPVAGGGNNEQLLNQMEAHCFDKYIIWEAHPTRGKDDVSVLSQKIKGFNPDVLLIAGGDGSINQLLPAFVDLDIQLGIIPAGSANGLAKSLKIDDENCWEIAFNHNYTQLDVVTVNNKSLIHLGDLGINASLVKKYEETDRSGFLGYAISAIEDFNEWETFEVTITKGLSKLVYETSMLAISNARMYGTGFELNKSGVPYDGILELNVLKPFDLKSVGRLLFSEEESMPDSPFHVIAGNQFKVNVSRKVPFQIDGEYLGEENELEISILPNQINVKTPKANTL